MAVRARRDLLGFACLAAALLLLPASGWAAGSEIPEQGALNMARGGTSATVPGTAYGLQFNPALLTEVVNFDARLDVRMTSSRVTFKRAPHLDNISGDTNFESITNSPGIFAAPAVYLAERIKGTPLVAAFGVFGPAGVGSYKYPNPYAESLKEGVYYEDVLSKTGQRYALIGNANQLLMPTIGVGWKITDWISVGLSIGIAVARLDQSSAVAGASAGGVETVQSDAFAHLNVGGFAGPILIPGVLIQPVKAMRIGIQARSGFTLDLPGTVNVLATPDLGKVTQNTNEARLITKQPTTARLGLSYDFGLLTLALEGTFEGWSANKIVVLDASKVRVFSPSKPQGTVLGRKEIEKNWKDSYSGRFGGTVRILQEPQAPIALQAHFGGVYETNAIPSEYQSVDAVTGNRLGGSLGVTASWHGLGLTLAGMAFAPTHIEVTNSQLRRGVSGLTNDQAKLEDNVIIGNGTYDASIWVFTIGISYQG